MNYVYFVPALGFQNPAGLWHAALCPDGETMLVVVEHWASSEEQDLWEALPGVDEFHPYMWSQPVGVMRAAALEKIGVVPGHSGHDAMKRARAHFRALRPA